MPRRKKVEEEPRDELLIEEDEEIDAEPVITPDDFQTVRGKEIVEKLASAGISGSDDIAVQFYKKRGTKHAYCETVPLSDISTLPEHARQSWGPGSYKWQLCDGSGRWLKRADYPDIPLSGYFEVYGEERSFRKQDEETGAKKVDYQEALREGIMLAKEALTKQSDGDGFKDIAEIFNSFAAGTKETIRSLQQQSEQNVKTVIENMKLQMETMTEMMQSERELYRTMIDQANLRAEQQMERERALYEMLIEMNREVDKPLAEKALDKLGSILQNITPQQGTQTLVPVDETKGETMGDINPDVMMVKFVEILREGKNRGVEPTVLAEAIRRDADLSIVRKIDFGLAVFGVEGTLQAAEKRLKDAGIELDEELMTYSVEVMKAFDDLRQGELQRAEQGSD